MSWLAEHVDLPAELTPRALADALIRTGLEVEGLETAAPGLAGPIVVGRVLTFQDEPQNNGKIIRLCSVDVGEDGPRQIVCGAENFSVGDLVVVSLPGATLAGGVAISSRKTYGHVSDGMICSSRELGIGDEHDGILVLLADSASPGDDPLDLLELRDAVLDVAVTTDRGYCLSIRGLAREAASAFEVPFREVTALLPEVNGRAYDVKIEDLSGCNRFSARAVTRLDPQRLSPGWMIRRLHLCGIRSISLAVDVTNYVMLETGQPLHAFDRAKLRGGLGVRRAQGDELLTTLDGVVRTLDEDDLVVTDASGPIALAGVMGGASTEISDNTTDVILEAAHWDADSIARTVRRHKLPSEAARRFERDVDPEIAGTALARCVELLVAYGGAQAVDGYTVVGTQRERPLIALHAERPQQVAGMAITRQDVIRHLEAVGCTVNGEDELQVGPPSWRPDLALSADLVEEVVRLVGYDKLPSVLPAAPAGTGLTQRQKVLRNVSRAIAAAGYVEVLSYPFVSPAIHDALGLEADDPRRRAVRLVNPLSSDEPELRTSLLPGLLNTALSNVGRGQRDLALFETGIVFRQRPDTRRAETLSVDTRPTSAQLGALDAGLPWQPRRLAVVLTGDREPKGWLGDARPATWADAVEAARVVARAARVEITTRAAQLAPWHPGRCAQLLVNGQVIGYAGELHPRAIAGRGLPDQTCAMELDLDALPVSPPARAPIISRYPPVLLDVSMVVPTDVSAASVQAALRDAGGPLLESVRLFDLFADSERIGTGMRSLTFALRFRAHDRTLTLSEVTASRDRALSAVERTLGVQARK